MKIENRTRLVLVLTAVVFVSCLITGFFLASKKPLWTDEVYTQDRNIDVLSYKKMLLGKVTEGNIAPLFYLIQKGICDIARYKFTLEWDEYHEYDMRSQLIMRINPNIFMSLSIALIFYYFLRNYSFMAGIYSLLISLSSFMVWAYWAEARPYAMWVFLTTVQSLIFIDMMNKEDAFPRLWKWIAFVHILVSLTVIFGIAQIMIVSFLLVVLKNRDWKKYIFITVVPVLIGLAYYFKSQSFVFRFWHGPIALLSANIPKDRMLIVLLYAFLLLAYHLTKKTKLRKLYSDELQLAGGSYLALFGLAFFSAVALLVLFWIKKMPVGFPVSNRFFIYLTPIGIIAVTLFSIDMVKMFKGRIWLRAGIILGLASLLAFRLDRTYPFIKSLY